MCSKGSGVRTSSETAFEAVTQDVFPYAHRYAALKEGFLPLLRERSSTGMKPFPWSERHVQCVWYDPALRPDTLRTTDGEKVVIENPGIWNQEAGPDFLGAVVLIGPDRRRLAGDTEIHIHPADWAAHGHENDPRYGQVRFHVTYFSGPVESRPSRPGLLHIPLQKSLATHPGFYFEHIDVAAYPYAMRAVQPPCSLVLKKYSPERRYAVLRAAGEERLRLKALRMAQRIEELGAEQTLYEECMAALGYKHNKSAGRQLAARLPVDRLSQEAQGDPRRAYALLLGASGLMPSEPQASWDAETRQFMRSAWDTWWRYRERYADTPPPEWRLDGLRPANHPLRRLMAAAHLFGGTERLSERWITYANQAGPNWIDALMDELVSVQDEYWSRRLSFRSPRQKKPIALIGKSRAAAILTNVVLPFLTLSGMEPRYLCDALDRLPVEPDNGIIKQTAHHLFGRDHAPSLYRTELARQGLIQIFQDFCLNDRSRCAACLMPEALERQASHFPQSEDTNP